MKDDKRLHHHERKSAEKTTPIIETKLEIATTLASLDVDSALAVVPVPVPLRLALEAPLAAEPVPVAAAAEPDTLPVGAHVPEGAGRETVAMAAKRFALSYVTHWLLAGTLAV